MLALARGSRPRAGTSRSSSTRSCERRWSAPSGAAPELRFNLELAPTVITSDPDRVNRAVTNLVDNACKWSAADGEVEIELHDGVLSVRDHGPGFDERDVAHVFDRFYRADNARRMPGSGLGLAIVKQAAEAGGGSAVAANAEGGGGVVRVRFS